MNDGLVPPKDGGGPISALSVLGEIGKGFKKDKFKYGAFFALVATIFLVALGNVSPMLKLSCGVGLLLTFFFGAKSLGKAKQNRRFLEDKADEYVTTLFSVRLELEARIELLEREMKSLRNERGG